MPTYTHEDGRTLSPPEGSALDEVLSKDPAWGGSDQEGERVPALATPNPEPTPAPKSQTTVPADAAGVEFTSKSAEEKAEGLTLEPGGGSGKGGAYTVADVEAAG